MYKLSLVILLAAAILSLGPTACSTRQVAAGAVVGGAAYEYSNKRAMDSLREDYREGRVNSQEYERRKQEIEDRSLVY